MDIIIVIFFLALLSLFERKFNIKKKYSAFSDKFHTPVIDVSIFIAIMVLVFFIDLPLFKISEILFGAIFLSLIIYAIYIISPSAISSITISSLLSIHSLLFTVHYFPV
ncbi:MAG: hypothetical protein AAGU75_24195 [Bacillota bacterium]